MSKVAFITGITGQDGSFLAEFLLKKGYHVHGLIRRSSNNDNLKRVWHLHTDPTLKSYWHLHYGDLMDQSCLIRLFREIQPDEIYNLAAQSHVKISFEIPDYTVMTSGVGALKMLEAIRLSGLAETTRLYQAGSSEMYGDVLEKPQTETTPFNPQSPYASAKALAHNLVKNYRESYQMYAVNGILFNHESERRGFNFVTRKITNWVRRFHQFKTTNQSLPADQVLQLGNLDAKRDWGYAGDYIQAMWLMLHQKDLRGMSPETPNDQLKDYVVATGKQYTVRDFLERALVYFGYRLEWQGSGDQEQGFLVQKNKEPMDIRELIVQVNPQYYRPNEVEDLLGDPSLIQHDLGWEPQVNIDRLIEIMLTSDESQSY